MWMIPVPSGGHLRRLLDVNRRRGGGCPAMEEDGRDPMLPPSASGSDRSGGNNFTHSTHGN